ncbi:MAG: hypothetical protein ACLQED_15440 [Desulfobaccales bacterium]
MSQPPSDYNKYHSNREKDDESQTIIHAENKNDKISNYCKYNGYHKHKISWPSKVTAVCTIFIVGITFCYTYYAKQQVARMEEAITANKDSIELIKQTFVFQNRPWVSIDASVGSDFLIDKNGAAITIIFTIKNWGKSPAVNVLTHFKMVEMDITQGFQNIMDVQKNILNIITKGEETADSNARYILSPNQEFVQELKLTIDRKTMQNLRTKQSSELNNLSPDNREIITYQIGRITPYIVGYIGYKFVFDKTVHKTGFLAQIHRIDPKTPGLWNFNAKQSRTFAKLIKITRIYLPGEID